ncbi:MAG: RNA polymerase sigma factor [Taibaiella sp.]|nr:RNA polymerase sigma factor [Taibaiella sp.]
MDKELAFEDDLLRLIKECIANDRKAQRSLYDRYAGTLFGVIRRYECNLEMAEEILNDVFIIIFTKLGQYSFSGSFEGWMKRIAINCTTDYFRRNAKHKKVINTDDFEKIDPYIEDEICSKIFYKELLQVIYTLPETHRIVFNLFVFESRTHKEIADGLGISEGYSKWYLNDARKKIKETINSMK